MANLRDQFEHFYAPDEDAVATALRTGLVTPDTNVLLNLYRFQSETREQLLGALESIGDRLWIPYQVAFEFHRNRLKVIADHESYFSKTGSDLDSAFNTYMKRLKEFCNRISVPPSDAQNLVRIMQSAHDGVRERVFAAEQANEVHLNRRNSDPVLRRLEDLFGDQVGGPMKPDELDAARKEAKRRIEAKIPPGYMDKEKPDPAGDYILWKQLIDEASIRKLPTILITDDLKEDWVWREHGQTIGAQYQLRDEMMTVAGVPFLIMTTSTFLEHAKKFLNVPVSQASVDQAKELQDSLEQRRRDASMRLAATRAELNFLLKERVAIEQRTAQVEARLYETEELRDELLHQDESPPVQAALESTEGRLRDLKRERAALKNEQEVLRERIMQTRFREEDARHYLMND